MALRVWMNRTYATHMHTLGMIRHNPDGVPVQIFGTHRDLDSPVLQACDFAAPEPELTGDDYVDYALEFCARHRIEVFIPRLEMVAIARRAAEFRAAGVGVMCSPARSVELLEDKDLTYRSARDANFPVPPWRIASTADEFAQAYADLSPVAERVCFKPVIGVGGDGFRIVDDSPAGLEDLLEAPRAAVSSAHVLKILAAAEAAGRELPRLMVLPYMSGPEVSVDCLSSSGGTLLTAVARTKVGRRRLLAEDAECVSLTRKLVAHYGLEFLSNIQFRNWQGRAHLLEINTRAAGGVSQTQLAGINLPWAAVRLALGERVELAPPSLPVALTAVPDVVRLLDLTPPDAADPGPDPRACSQRVETIQRPRASRPVPRF